MVSQHTMNAALVQAHAAQVFLLEQDDLQAGVTGPLGGQVTGGAAADDAEIKQRNYPFS